MLSCLVERQDKGTFSLSTPCQDLRQAHGLVVPWDWVCLFLVCPSTANVAFGVPGLHEGGRIFQIFLPWKVPGIRPWYPELCRVCKCNLKFTQFGKRPWGQTSFKATLPLWVPDFTCFLSLWLFLIFLPAHQRLKGFKKYLSAMSPEAEGRLWLLKI